jgi:hypothetical protein
MRRRDEQLVVGQMPRTLTEPSFEEARSKVAIRP